MSVAGVPLAPAQAPQLRRGFWHRLCRWLIGLSGWRVVGQLPDLPKLILIGAPHSSYWDGVWGLLMKIAIGIDLNIMIKREVLDGPLGPILRPIGLIPIDRGAATDVVGQMVARFASRERMWLGITPEGTRRAVKQWKSGFLRIARAAGVPVQPIYIDYPSRTFTIGPLMHAGDDLDADMAAIRAQFRPYRGKRRNTE